MLAATSLLPQHHLSFAQSEVYGVFSFTRNPRPYLLPPPGKWRVITQNAVTLLAEPGAERFTKVEREPHKYFDQVVITVRSGDGGHGAVLSLPRPAPKTHPTRKDKDDRKKKGKMKKDSDGSLILPMGGHGGDVLIYASESEDSLLEYHKKKRYFAKRGGNVDAMGYLSSFIRDGASASSLRIPVPVGTVVKRKRGGKLLADLVRPGDEVLVARGGRGGISMVEIPKSNQRHLWPSPNVTTMKDPDDKALVLGAPGEEITLELTLRVVADVGLVGLPNAGKSSLLAAVTRAKPEIAAYPFTTLMPNLGHLAGDPEKDGGFSKGPKMADLPGLIKGAHLGKGLGRMFLRHLRRTSILVHVVDASTEDPLQDYKILREELLMYNPDYLNRPHVVVLNKLDIPEAKDRFQVLKDKILQIGIPPPTFDNPANRQSVLPKDDGEDIPNASGDLSLETEESTEGTTDISTDEDMSLDKFPCASAVTGISALEGSGIETLLQTIRTLLQNLDISANSNSERKSQQRRQLYNSPHWQM